MLNGEIYQTNYKGELFKELLKAKELCFKYNILKPSNLDDS